MRIQYIVSYRYNDVNHTSSFTSQVLAIGYRNRLENAGMDATIHFVENTNTNTKDRTNENPTLHSMDR